MINIILGLGFIVLVLWMVLLVVQLLIAQVRFLLGDFSQVGVEGWNPMGALIYMLILAPFVLYVIYA